MESQDFKLWKVDANLHFGNEVPRQVVDNFEAAFFNNSKILIEATITGADRCFCREPSLTLRLKATSIPELTMGVGKHNIPHKCPVCEGRGHMPIGFYGADDKFPPACRSCKNGIIWGKK